jgi:hypothetical protein
MLAVEVLAIAADHRLEQYGDKSTEFTTRKVLVVPVADRGNILDCMIECLPQDLLYFHRIRPVDAQGDALALDFRLKRLAKANVEMFGIFHLLPRTSHAAVHRPAFGWTPLNDVLGGLPLLVAAYGPSVLTVFALPSRGARSHVKLGQRFVTKSF